MSFQDTILQPPATKPHVEYRPPARNPGDEPGDVIEVVLHGADRVRLTYDEAKTLVADLYRAMTARNRHPAHNRLA